MKPHFVSGTLRMDARRTKGTDEEMVFRMAGSAGENAGRRNACVDRADPELSGRRLVPLDAFEFLVGIALLDRSNCAPPLIGTSAKYREKS